MKKVIKNCVVCGKAEGKPNLSGKPPDLPSSRVSDDPPFTNVGLDFAGPLYIRVIKLSTIVMKVQIKCTL